MTLDLTPYYNNKITNTGDMDYRFYMEKQSKEIRNAIQQSAKHQLEGNAIIAGRQASEIGNSVVRMQTGIQTAISDQTSAIVASNNVLAQTYQQGFDELNNTLIINFAVYYVLHYLSSKLI